jgi:hypothetical protein
MGSNLAIDFGIAVCLVLIAALIGELRARVRKLEEK